MTRHAGERSGKPKPTLPLERFMAFVSQSQGCWLWKGSIRGKGYGQFWYNSRMEGAHRVAWMLLRSPIPDDLHVLHRCDTPLCVNPSHLFVGTISDNAIDMKNKGRASWQTRPETRARGGRNGSTKLTAEQVRLIRERHNAGEAAAALARQYRVSDVTVLNVVKGKYWRHVG